MTVLACSTIMHTLHSFLMFIECSFIYVMLQLLTVTGWGWGLGMKLLCVTTIIFFLY